MNNNKNNLANLFLYLFYLGFLVSVAGGFRAISSIAIGLILVTSFIKNKTETGSWFNPGLRNKYVIACSLFFLLQIIPLAYTNDFLSAWQHVQVKSALLFIPLCFYGCSYINKTRFNSLMTAYVYMLAIMLTWCLGVSFIKYHFQQADITVFFYHDLARDLGYHAVHFSIFVFAGLIYLLQIATGGRHLVNRTIHFLLIAYFIGGILLLSSKLVIIFMLACLVFYFFILLQKNLHTKWAIAIVAITGILFCSSILFTKNPINRRFADLMHGNIGVIQQTSFSPANYFNGVQFRLLQWRFVKEIMQENKAWLFGVTPAKAQSLLNQKYLSTHMYTGEPGSARHGYLGYNTHNQFLEALLQTGIIGLICFMAICFEMIKITVQQKSRMLTALVTLLLAYALFESVLETQYGLVFFIFLPLFFARPNSREPTGKTAPSTE
ncbi:O-antigen ligase family protein [Niastella caeni]|uniref:O-antigen ligase family protein n=1 Tax=Niastella caeni TaxID=2569763 RepID=A0A4S8HGD0_9BACT|nr:O-antigen ligase family protein [Niastella caeni]THU33541.1 O-antigen ligase family protein [Niastella caeni]